MPDGAQHELDSRIGALAVRKGHLSPAELQAALQRQRALSAAQEYRPLGDLLVEAGKLTPEELDGLLNEQTATWMGQRVLGRYKLLEKIGEGGMGAVWKAMHVDLGNTVAIKLLPRSVVGDLALVERFHEEARMMAAINHTNIVQAFDAGEADGQPYFVMPFLDGASLGQILRKCGRMGVRTGLSIALQVVRGLRYAHDQGMVHRDLKPDNLFLTHDGTVKILDLGLAKLIEAGPDARRSTQTGMIVGTPQYMSPEQIMGDVRLDGRSDIYSLGATLFHLLCGSAPFPGQQGAVVLRRKLEQPPPDPKEANPGLPIGVRKLILSMLARKPGERPANGETLEAEIEALLDGKPISGSSLSPESIVLGQSEREQRTFSLSSSNSKAPRGATAPIPRRIGSQDPSVTAVIARPGRPASLHAAAATLGQVASERAAEQPGRVAAAAQARMPSWPAPASDDTVPAPPRIAVGWLGQLLAALVLVVLTVIITLAVVQMRAGERRSPAPPGAKR